MHPIFKDGIKFVHILFFANIDFDLLHNSYFNIIIIYSSWVFRTSISWSLSDTKSFQVSRTLFNSGRSYQYWIIIIIIIIIIINSSFSQHV